MKGYQLVKMEEYKALLTRADKYIMGMAPHQKDRMGGKLLIDLRHALNELLVKIEFVQLVQQTQEHENKTI